MKPSTLCRRAIIWVRRLRALTVKELLQLSRDPVLMLFIAYLFTANVYIQGTSVTFQLARAAMLVRDGDRTAASRELIHRFRPPYFRFDGQIGRDEEGLRRLDRGDAMVVLDIPPGFEKSLLRGESVSVQMQVDATDTVPGFLAASYGARITAQYGREIALARQGFGPDDLRSMPSVTAEPRVWFNPNQEETWFIPIVELLEAITLIAILLPTAAMVREKERGTVEQLLVSPLSPTQIMLSKVIAMAVVVVTGMTLTLFGVLRPVFGIPLRGNLALFYLITIVYVFASAGLGLFAATVARNLAQVGLLTLLLAMPIIVLSGLSTPPEAMPGWLRVATLASPLRHYIDAAFGVLLKGAGFDLLWDSVLAMSLLGGLVFSFGVWRFRRQFV